MKLVNPHVIFTHAPRSALPSRTERCGGLPIRGLPIRLPTCDLRRHGTSYLERQAWHTLGIRLVLRRSNAQAG